MATPAARRASRTDAAATRCADDTQATCTDTALSDVRAIYERAVAITAAADASARPTATKLMLHLNLEASGTLAKAEADNVLNVLRAVVGDAAAPFVHALPAANNAAARNLLATFVGILQKRASHEAHVFAEAGASSPVLTPASGASGGGGGAPPLMHLPPITLSNAEDKKNLRISEAGAYLEKHVPAGSEAGEDEVDDPVLAADGLAHIGAEAIQHHARLFHPRGRDEITHPPSLAPSGPRAKGFCTLPGRRTTQRRGSPARAARGGG